MKTARQIWRHLAGAGLVLALGACSSAGQSAEQAAEQIAPEFDVAAAVAAIRASGDGDAGELQVQPLRDPQVEDLREQAAALEARRMHQAAADTLDLALQINPEDPALLQERAEVALLLRDVDTAERLATRAFGLGSQVGPLCRRHWETVAQVRSARPAADAGATDPAMALAAAATAAQAREQRDACTVAPPPRY